MFLEAWKLVSSTGRNWNEPGLLFCRSGDKTEDLTLRYLQDSDYYPLFKRKKKMFSTRNISNNSLVGINININIVNDFCFSVAQELFCMFTNCTESVMLKKKESEMPSNNRLLANMHLIFTPSQTFGYRYHFTPYDHLDDQGRERCQMCDGK